MSSSAALAQSFHDALTLYQSGRLDEAARAYRAILQAHPDQFETLHHLGMLEAQQGRYGEALQAAREADCRACDAGCRSLAANP